MSTPTNFGFANRRRFGRRKNNKKGREDRMTVIKELEKENKLAVKGPGTRGPPTRRQAKKIARNAARRQLREKAGNQVSKEISPKALAVDLRTVSPQEAEIFLKNVQEAIEIGQVIFEGTLVEVCIAYVTQAVEHGFLTFAANPNYPYWAFAYMYSILAQYVQAGVSPATSLPLWLLGLCQALSPKAATFSAGTITYAYQPSDAAEIPPSLVPVGPESFNYKWNLYVPGTGNLDLFPVAQAPSAVPTDLGLEAWNSLTLFMSDKNSRSKTKQMNNMVLATENTFGKTSVSAFSVPSNVMGGAGCFSGGWAYNAQLEVPIREPILASFGGYALLQNAVEPIRYPNRSTASSGSPMWTSAFCSRHTFGEWKGKKFTVFKCIDFLRFGDILAQWVGAIQTAFMTNPSTVTAYGAFPPQNFVCPLTLQEMLLLLRNEIMTAFVDTQSGVQSIFPVTPASDAANNFVAYIAAQTTCSMGTCGMKLPQSIVENIRSLVARSKKISGSRDMEFYVPVLGQYNQVGLVTTDYTFEYITPGDEPTTITINSFAATPSIMMRRRDSKTSMDTWVPAALTEQVIRLVDGYTTGTPTGYLFINDTDRLSALATSWNAWLSNQLSAYSDPLIQLGTETGISILSSITWTSHWLPPSTFTKNMREDYRDTRLIRKKSISSTAYNDMVIQADTTQGRPLAASYQQIQSSWVLPSNQIIISDTDSSAQTTIQRTQAASREPFTVTRNSTGVGGIPMSQLNSSYAQKMARGQMTEKNDWLVFFEQADRSGEGGVLSGLLAQFLGNKFGSTAGAVSGAVADLLPI